MAKKRNVTATRSSGGMHARIDVFCFKMAGCTRSTMYRNTSTIMNDDVSFRELLRMDVEVFLVMP